jgi:alanyl-tRNA synthetase
MTANELRKKYLDFFKEKGHTIIPSASLVPENDPSVLFTSAGMQPLVPYLMGESHPGGKRVASVQKCVRTSDIDDVGDNRHCTFFEMLGNWSFGDYFKKEAIEWSAEFLFEKKWLGLDSKRIFVTTFRGENGIPADVESPKIWQEVFEKYNIKAEVAGMEEIIKDNVKIIPLGVEDNFWIAGATGPCGPDTEMFYDTRPGDGAINDTFQNLVKSGRLIEIWNDVFMEFEKKRKTLLVDGMHCLYDKNFTLNQELLDKLLALQVDIIVVVNGFAQEAMKLLGATNVKVFSCEVEKIKKENKQFFEILKDKYKLNSKDVIYFDHDSNNLKGANDAGISLTILYKNNNEKIISFIKNNLYFYVNLSQQNVDTGMGIERTLAVLNGKENVFETELFQPIIEKIEEISGKKYSGNEKAFRIISDHIKTATFMLADGVEPLNVGGGYVLRRLIRRAVRYGKLLGVKNNLTIRIVEVISEIYKNQYPELEKNKNKILNKLEKEENKSWEILSKDKGITALKKIFGLAIGGIDPDNLPKGMILKGNKIRVNGEIVFHIYQQHGIPIEVSQEIMHDWGVELDGETMREADEAFKKHQDLSRTASAGQFKGGLQSQDASVTKLHTATHLLNAALRQVLGENVYQKGSNITAERLRFDFSHSEKMTPEQIKKTEDLVNEQIQKDLPVTMEEMHPDEAAKQGAIGVFGHKYGEVVKVYSAGNFSKEICGGPHVEHTRELGKFKIIKEEASSAGVRRIKATLS